MKNTLTPFAAAVMGLALVITVFIWHQPVGVEKLWVPLSATAAPVEGPPCTHKICAERPAHLQCVYMQHESHTNSSALACARWDIEYEHHCDCDRWGAP